MDEDGEGVGCLYLGHKAKKRQTNTQQHVHTWMKRMERGHMQGKEHGGIDRVKRNRIADRVKSMVRDWSISGEGECKGREDREIERPI